MRCIKALLPPSPFSFAILLRQGYEETGYEETGYEETGYVETSYGGQAGLRLIQDRPWAGMTNVRFKEVFRPLVFRYLVR